MLQVQAPVQSHVTSDGITEKCYNAYVHDFKGVCKDEVENTTKEAYFNDADDMALKPAHKENIPSIEDNEYVIMERKSDTKDPDLNKSAESGENRISVFDDSDYDEVIDFLTSPNEVGNLNSKNEFNEQSVKNSVSTDPDSSNRSSASSTTSGIESGEEKPTNAKYAQLDLAKILHTRRRIHRILQLPLDGGVEKENKENVNRAQSSSTGKKKSYLSKRNTHYGTLGSSRNKSSSSMPRNSRPPSAGDELLNSSFSSDFYFDDPLRKKSEAASNYYALKQIPKSDQTRHKSSDSDEDDKNAEDSRRWSRISSTSQNSDKNLLSPHKGPWKAFRKFVNTSTSSSRQLSHDEIKATIHLSTSSNSSNNNNNNTGSLRKDSSLLDVSGYSGNNASLASSFGSPDTRMGSKSSTDLQDKDVPRRHTNSLLRRFSRRTSRSRSVRRKSLPVDNVLGVNPTPDSASNYLPSHMATPPESFERKSESCSRIENIVMTSVQNRHDVEDKRKTPEKPRKSNSIRKRLMSFSMKRSSSQERKTILKDNIPSKENENGQMNKALSYSSPQLSVFAVNPNTKQPAPKLVF